MAAKDDSAITQDDIQEDEETTTPVAVLVSMSDTIQKLTSRLDDFVLRHNPDHIPPPKRSAISEEDGPPVWSRQTEELEDDREETEEADTKAMKARTFSVSTPTKAFLQASFCLPKPVDNPTRRSWVERFGLPSGDETRCPKMDGLIKGELGKEAVEANRKLSRLQNFTLDAAAPLVAALEELTERDELDPSTVSAAIQLSLRFLGNASAQFSVERCTRALPKFNPDLKSMAEEEDFSQAVPYLFGPGFEKKAKERTEALECLRKVAKPSINYSSASSQGPSRKKFFRGTRSHRNSGGGSRNDYRRKGFSQYNRGPSSGPTTAGAKKA